MDYISVKEFAQKYEVSERTARNYCASGKIEGVVLVGKTWNIPVDATLPMRKSKKQQISPLLSILREQKNMKLKGGIYHRTQIDGKKTTKKSEFISSFLPITARR